MGLLVKAPGPRANHPRPACPSPRSRTERPRIDIRPEFFRFERTNGAGRAVYTAWPFQYGLCAAVRVARVACGGIDAPALAAPGQGPAGRPAWTPPAAPTAEAGRRG